MIQYKLSLFALTALAVAAAAPPVAAQCCRGCAYGCAPPVAVEVPPAPIQIWGLTPSFVVNQGPVYSGPGFYTSPTYEGETLTVDYPHTGYYAPFDRGPYDSFRHQLYSPYWPYLPGGHPRHFTTFHRSEGGVIYQRGFGPRALTMSERHHGDRDPSLR